MRTIKLWRDFNSRSMKLNWYHSSKKLIGNMKIPWQRNYLISDLCAPSLHSIKYCQVLQYHVLNSNFPICHSVLDSSLTSCYFKVDIYNIMDSGDVETPEEEIHWKERMVLFLFFVLLRTKNPPVVTLGHGWTSYFVSQKISAVYQFHCHNATYHSCWSTER